MHRACIQEAGQFNYISGAMFLAAREGARARATTIGHHGHGLTGLALALALARCSACTSVWLEL
jgi:hypothetical protein